DMEARLATATKDLLVDPGAVRGIGRCGAKLSAGPRPLKDRGEAPIYDFQYQGRSLFVWFQRALPVEKSGWHYKHSGEALKAIPDISVSDSSGSPLIVDAKNRFTASDTRSEE